MKKKGIITGIVAVVVAVAGAIAVFIRKGNKDRY